MRQKKRLLEKMPTGSKEKTAAGKLKTEGAGKDPEVARNKMIQRTLGVKVDGIMGTKSMAALEAMKQTQSWIYRQRR
jgi:murein L,D-transpeptidase YcbB/YkuD